jgi:hypothetical protein
MGKHAVSQKPAKTATQESQHTRDYQAWRAEIEAFCQQTIAHLQECIEAAESAERAELARPAPDRQEHSPGMPPSLSPPAVSTSSAGDLDTSQDRLANLKRELAAKLSKARREQK